MMRVIRSSGMRLEKNVACMGRGVLQSGFGCGSLKERDYFEDLGVGGTIILKLI